MNPQSDRKMTMKRILIVSGTHGNEINPVWAVEQFGKIHNYIDNDIEFKYTIGNPLACEKGLRYIDQDLNRSFDLNKNSNFGNYETKRANFLVNQFGDNGNYPCNIAIDLHTTTANMGTSIVMYGRRSKDFCLAALLQNKFGLPIYLHENDMQQTGFLVEAWPCGLVIEIGPVAQNFYDPMIIKRFLIILSSLRAEIRNLEKNITKLPEKLTVYLHKGSIDYPREKNGNIKGLIHPERINRDWQTIKRGDPLFLDINGKTISYEGEEKISPVFIGEASYKEKNIAMSLAKKEIIFSTIEWIEDFFVT